MALSHSGINTSNSTGNIRLLKQDLLIRKETLQGPLSLLLSSCRGFQLGQIWEEGQGAGEGSRETGT